MVVSAGRTSPIATATTDCVSVELPAKSNARARSVIDVPSGALEETVKLPW
jgi:hypothetical protein